LYSVGLATRLQPASSSHRASIGWEESGVAKNSHKGSVKVMLSELSW
jgi:hypothetical protein